MSRSAGIHLLVGDDPHLLHRATEDTLAALREQDPELEVTTVDAAGLGHLPEVRTASLFATRRCLVVRQVEEASTALRSELETLVEDPAADLVLVLVVSSPGRVRRLVDRARRAGAAVTEVRVPPPWRTADWEALVADELRRHGREAERAALRAILDRAGADTTAVAWMAATVAAITPAGRRISADDVAAAVAGQGNRGAFAVADAIEARDPAAALVALRGALRAGEEPLAVLGAVSHRLRQLLQVRGGATADEVGVSGARHRRLVTAARRFNPGELAWCHERLTRADRELKGSDLPADVVVEVVVLEVATSREVGAPWNPLS